MSKLELLLLVLAILGGIDLASKGWEFISRLFPRFLSVQARTWRVVADSVTIPAFRRRAIATRVEEVLNQTAFKLQRHLPRGWIKRAKIRWVRHAKASQLHDGDIVLRVRPATNSEQNLMQSLWLYFRTALFPDSRDVLPDDVVAAVALAITRTSLEENHEYLLKEFDEVFLPAVGAGKQGILEHFADCVRLNEYGLLMGPFVRELDHAANQSRLSADRTMLPTAVKGILNHMLGFQPLTRINKPDEDWFYEGPCTSYGFVLVSKPPEFRPGIDAYVKRAQANVRRGIERCYVIGRHEERDFVYSVISALLAIRELKGIEVFALLRDYRGDANGVGALLGLDQMLAKLNLPHRPLEALHVGADLATPRRELVSTDVTIETDSREENDLSRIAEEIIVQLSDYEHEWINLSEFGIALRQQIPGFTPERYGGRNLFAVLKGLPSLEFEERGVWPAKVIHVRLRGGTNHGQVVRACSDGESAAKSRITTIVKLNAAADGWIFLGRLGHLLKKEFPDFAYADFEASSLREFVSRISTLQLEDRGDGPAKSTYARVRE